MIPGHVVLDTGPLVAYLDGRDAHHVWAMEQFSNVAPPLWTCEAVISETCFLLRRWKQGRDAVLSMLEHGAVRIHFSLDEEHHPVAALMRRYADLPMSLADACLVRMSELTADCAVLTLDRDFRVYRRHGRQKIPLLIPPDG